MRYRISNFFISEPFAAGSHASAENLCLTFRPWRRLNIAMQNSEEKFPERI
jgi:hypothetical protein